MFYFYRLVDGILEVLDGCFPLYNSEDKLATHKSLTITTATKFLTLPTPPSMQMHSKALLSSLHNSKQAYHNYKVRKNIFSNLNELDFSIKIEFFNLYMYIIL